MMDFIFITGGALAGVIIGRLIEKRNKIHGVIDVDHHTNQCKIRITSEELANPKTKKVIFAVNHDAVISREEQIL